MELWMVFLYVLNLWHYFRLGWDLDQPFTHGFSRANIHELLSPNLLHQIIKGTFKDHLVTWVIDYIEEVHTPAEAKRILADIDRWYAQIAWAVSMCVIVIFRIAAAPPFPGLRRFPEGCRFKQWTGDDSKALMKVDYVTYQRGFRPKCSFQGFSSCDCWLCSRPNGPCIEFLYGILLPRSPICDRWRWYCLTWDGTTKLSPWPICLWLCLPWWVLFTSSALDDALHSAYLWIWCIQWALLIDNRIKAYKSSQRTLATI